MMDFYGLSYNTENKTVSVKDENKEELKWIRKNNHNYQRITRILEFLVLMDRQDLAQAFHVCLKDLGQKYSQNISEETLRFWEQAFEVNVPNS